MYMYLRSARKTPRSGCFRPVFASQVTKKSPVGLFERNKMNLFLSRPVSRLLTCLDTTPPALAPKRMDFLPVVFLHFSVFFEQFARLVSFPRPAHGPQDEFQAQDTSQD